MKLGLAFALLAAAIAACGSPSAASSPTPSPQPQDLWVEARLDAYVQVYGITEEGQEMLAALDVRHMVGQPAWFGSTGFDGFAGIGESKSASIAHELGHSYWGAFPVTGRPNLSWDPNAGDAYALTQYQEDLRIFMLQPPDGYEPLRERFRNLPNLIAGEYSDLIHLGEADMVSLVAGDLNLVPPILRKYYDQYLSPGRYQTWDDILLWYQGLSGEDKRIADTYLGLAHIPTEAYRGLEPEPTTAVVPEQIRELILREERQRLIDFAQYFDLIVEREDSLADATGIDRGFPFWRGYLREMYDLHKRNPLLLSSLDSADRAGDIAAAFNTLKESESLGIDEKVAFLTDALAENSFLYNFLPTLSNRVLVKLLDTEEGAPPSAAAQKGTGAFVEELRRFIGEVDRILEIGRTDPVDGALALESYLAILKDRDEVKLEQDVDTIFELFIDTDRETTQAIMTEVADETIRELLLINPARTRFLLEPDRLLNALDIRIATASETLRDGLRELFQNSSGNFAVDRPFTEEVYRRISERGKERPQETLGVIRDSNLPLPEFLFRHAQDAVFILSSNLEQTADLVLDSGRLPVPPVRLIYHLIYVEPELAASVVDELGQRGENELASEGLIYFAYDFDRLQSNPELKTSLEGDGL
ncbi:MAG: hypothetical protein ACE5KI_07540, partial [Dehalococcoidia bacterium]